MNLTCDRAALTAAARTATRAVGSQIDGVGRILLRADDETLELLATDDRIGIRQKLAARIAGPGDVSVPIALFSDILQSMQTVNADDVRVVSSAENRLELTAEDATYNIAGTDPRSFPLIPSPDGTIRFSLPGELLRTIIRQVAVTATAGSATVLGYDKALVEARDGTLTMVTTDTVRLALKRVTLAGVPDFQVMVPIHALQELHKILTAADPANVIIGEDQISFTFGQTEFQARLCERDFPDYRKIIPKEHSRTFTVEAKGFGDALKGVLPVARESKNKVFLKIGGGTVVVTAQSHEGRAVRQLPAVVEGPELELAFNARFILDYLAVIDGKKVVWGVTSPIHPATLRTDGDGKDDGYTYLLMPINV